MRAMASQITSLTIVYSTVYSGANQRKHQSSVPLAFVTGEFPSQRASNAEVWCCLEFPFDDVIMRRISIMLMAAMQIFLFFVCFGPISVLSVYGLKRGDDVAVYSFITYLKILNQAAHSLTFVWKAVIISMLMPRSKIIHKPTGPTFNLVQHIYIYSFWRKLINKTARNLYIYPCIPAYIQMYVYRCIYVYIWGQ